jgi:hypothetical protein
LLPGLVLVPDELVVAEADAELEDEVVVPAPSPLPSSSAQPARLNEASRSNKVHPFAVTDRAGAALVITLCGASLNHRRRPSSA